MPEVVETQYLQSEPQVQDGPAASDASASLSSIHFKLPVFEGPLDLLLHLIRENKVDIYDIPIIDITRQYISYLELMKELNLEIAGEFLVMAATLIHIKSKMLLPPDEEKTQEPAEDPRSELVQRLLEYQSYKESSVFLRERETTWKNIFQRSTPEKDDLTFEPEPMLFEANVFDLITAFKKLLERAPAQTVEITRETLTVADRINFIMERIETEDGIRFEDLFEEGSSRVTLIVTFLALLEIVRLGLVKIYQENAFGIIWVINPQKQDHVPSTEAPQEVSAQ
ncbi:MAG: segregation/condensation protein A [Nitrospiraceae bacterium]|nr:MAG: segregation/condensation protein A [Nitrospiraceae bacterium]